jgi:hypothetical protein
MFPTAAISAVVGARRLGRTVEAAVRAAGSTARQLRSCDVEEMDSDRGPR